MAIDRVDLQCALRNADWRRLHPELVAYAERVLRRAGAAHRAHAGSPCDIVQSVIQQCLAGTRTWRADRVDLDGLLRGAIRSLAWAELKKSERCQQLEQSAAFSADCMVPSSEDLAVDAEARNELLARVAACTATETELGALGAAIAQGHLKRDEIACALGWRPERVSAARTKLRRRLRDAATPSPFP